MIHTPEQEEREYLEEIKEKLMLAIKRVDDSVKQYSTELRQSKEYIYEHQSGMDDADMVAAGQSINRMAFTKPQFIQLACRHKESKGVAFHYRSWWYRKHPYSSGLSTLPSGATLRSSYDWNVIWPRIFLFFKTGPIATLDGRD